MDDQFVAGRLTRSIRSEHVRQRARAFEGYGSLVLGQPTPESFSRPRAELVCGIPEHAILDREVADLLENGVDLDQAISEGGERREAAMYQI